MAVSNNWKNLKSFLRKAYNREVNEWFKDIPDAVPDNSGGRKQAKRACLILPKESQNMALIKVLNFRFTVQRTHLRPHVFGTPIGTVNAQRKYRPQVVLEFAEDELDVEPEYRRIDGRISFRLMDSDSDTISNADLIILANRIKAEFMAAQGYVWKKGKDLASYTDWDKGYQLQLLVRNKTDAKELIGKVLDIQSHTPSWSKLSYKENDNPTDAYPVVPGTHTILGKVQRKPRLRPTASVRFQWASCSIWGRSEPVILCDRTFTHLNPLV